MKFSNSELLGDSVGGRVPDCAKGELGASWRGFQCLCWDTFQLRTYVYVGTSIQPLHAQQIMYGQAFAM
jgi:hypothetical protein